MRYIIVFFVVFFIFCSFWCLFCVVIGVRQGDSFDILLHRYHRMLYSISRRLSRRGVAAEDLLQESSLALWQNRDKLMAVPEGPKRTAWVWRTAYHAAVDVVRRTKPTEPLPDNIEDLERESQKSGYESVRLYNRKELIEELYEQIGLLDEPDRTIVMMQLQGYSYEEIGQCVGMTVKNVSVRLVRIKEKLRLSMGGE